MLKLRILGTIFLFASLPCFAQAPAFMTQTPLLGNSGGAFCVFLPIANVGSGNANNIQLTSVELTLLGLPAATLLQPAALPFTVGFAAPTGVHWLDLEFDNSHLMSGNRYLLKVSGTYQSNGAALGFSLNRIIPYAPGGPSSHSQILDFISKKFQSRPRIDTQAENHAMLAFLKGLPQISAADVDDDNSTIGARFADDGETFMIMNNFPLPPQPGQTALAPAAGVSAVTLGARAMPQAGLAGPFSAAAPLGSNGFSAPTELPKTAKVRLLNGMTPAFDNTLPDLRAWLELKEYQVTGFGQGFGEASIANLRDISGDGVFYISSHAGSVEKTGLPVQVPFNIWTTTKYQDKAAITDAALLDDFNQHRLVGVAADVAWDAKANRWISETHFGILAKFVEDHWGDFEQNAIFYVDACKGDKNTPTTQAFKTEIFKKKASVYIGWTDGVHDDIAAATARLVFDRLLGVDQYCPEDGLPCHPGHARAPFFPQRAFDWNSVLTDLSLHSLGQDVGLGSKLTFTPNPNLSKVFGQLAPSIANMNPSEGQHQLYIFGSFGSDQGTVTIGDTAVAVITWKEDGSLIVTDLPSAASGDVVVTVGGHKSNAARLTKWQGGFTATLRGPGSTKQVVVFQSSFRVDLRKYRPVIHDPPVEPTSASIELINAESSAPYACSGTYTVTSPGRKDTYTWRQAGSLLPADISSLPITSKPLFYIVGALNMSHTEMTMQFNASDGVSNGSAGPCLEDHHISFVGPPPAQTDINDRSLDMQFNLLNANLRLNATTAVIAADDQTFKGRCDQVAVATQCGVTLHWDSIAPVPDTEPDPVDAR